MALTVGELAVELDARTTEFRRGLRAAESRLDRFDRTSTARTANVSRSFARMGGQIALVGAAITALGAALATVGLTRFVAAGIKSAATFESIGVSLEVLTGSAQGAAEVLDAVNTRDTETPFGLEEVASAARSVAVVFAEDTKQVAEFTRITADLAAATNRPIQLIGENLTRAFSAGLGAADAFREAGISKLILDQAMVTDVAKLSSEQLGQALRDLTSEGGRLFGAAARQAMTLGGAISNTAIAFELFRTEVGKAIGPNLAKILNTLIIPAFQRLQEIVIANSDAIATGFLRGFRAIITIGASVISTFASLVEFLNDIGITTRNVSIAIQILINSFGGFFSAAGLGFRTLKFLLLEFLAGLEKVPERIRDARDSFKELAEQDTSALQRRLARLREQASQLVQTAFELKEAGVGASFAEEERLRLVRERRQAIEEELARRGAPLRIDVDFTDAEKNAKEAFDAILRGANEFGVELAGRLITINNLVSELFDEGAADDAKVVQTLRKLLEAAGLAREEIDKLIASLGKAGVEPGAPDVPPPPAPDVAAEAGQVIGGGIATAIGTAVKDVLDGETGEDFATKIGEALEKQAREALEKSFTDSIKALTDGLKKALERVGSVLGDILGGEDGPLGKIGDFIGSKIGKEPGKLLGNIAVGAIGKGIQAFRREEDVRTMSAANITSAVSSVERVRGIVAGPTSIAVAQVDRAISDSFIETNRILERIEENTRVTATQVNDTATGSLPTGGTSAATAALANEGPSLV